MPELTGEKLAWELIKIRPDIPVILCTGYSERINAQKAREIGINAFVMKPLTLSHLAETIREVLENKGQVTR
jgi:two-component system cell cycle sensor histidine kinase/response regulator CckA